MRSPGERASDRIRRPARATTNAVAMATATSAFHLKVASKRIASKPLRTDRLFAPPNRWSSCRSRPKPCTTLIAPMTSDARVARWPSCLRCLRIACRIGPWYLRSSKAITGSKVKTSRVSCQSMTNMTMVMPSIRKTACINSIGSAMRASRNIRTSPVRRTMRSPVRRRS